VPGDLPVTEEGLREYAEQLPQELVDLAEAHGMPREILIDLIMQAARRTSTASKVRRMHEAGVATAEIARILHVRYQRVYNVLHPRNRRRHKKGVSGVSELPFGLPS